MNVLLWSKSFSISLISNTMELSIPFMSASFSWSFCFKALASKTYVIIFFLSFVKKFVIVILHCPTIVAFSVLILAGMELFCISFSLISLALLYSSWKSWYQLLYCFTYWHNSFAKVKLWSLKLVPLMFSYTILYLINDFSFAFGCNKLLFTLKPPSTAAWPWNKHTNIIANLEYAATLDEKITV